MIAVVDYGIGNLRSAAKAIAAAGGDAALVTDPDDLARAEGIVLPGVGSFGRCREALANSGMEATLRAQLEAGVPFLGICVGFQLLYQGSEESPGVEGLGVFTGTVGRLAGEVKVPQMQWNTVALVEGRTSSLLADPPPSWFYFVHSFAAPLGAETVATCRYGDTVAALAEQGNVVGAQFHPEKSGAVGLRFLGRFVERCVVR